MLQKAVAWGFVGLISTEITQIIFRNVQLKDWNKISWYGFIGMSAGIIRGWYGISIFELILQRLQ